jgi:hypothetical protein
MLSQEARKKAAEDGRPQLRVRQDAEEPTVRRRDLIE